VIALEALDMRRMSVVLALPLALLLAAGPAAADTTGGGNGTNLNGFGETCSGSVSRVTCTDTNLFVGPNGDGTNSTCLDILTYTVSSNGRQTFDSERFGCVIGGTVTVGSDGSVSLAPIAVPLETCAAHRRSCSGSITSTVSADYQIDGPVSTTTSRTTTTSGGCTFKTTSTETDANLLGTITVDGAATDSQGFLSIIDSTSTVRCR
jgi:hypothetical protein